LDPPTRTQNPEPILTGPPEPRTQNPSSLDLQNPESHHDCTAVANEPALRTRQTQDPKLLLELAPDGRTSQTQASSRTASLPRTPEQETRSRSLSRSFDTATDTNTENLSALTIMASPSLKKAKPPSFTGQDTSLATVTSWVFKIRSYVRASTDESEKVETAASFLTDTAERWLMAKYASAAELPTFDQFITAFQACFTRANDARRLRLTIESMDQGTRSVLEYHAEFETVLS